MTDIEDRLRQFIIVDCSWDGDPSLLSSDYELIENDVLDSLGIQQMVSFLEDDLGVEIADDDLLPDNFATLGAIGDLVRSKTG